MAGRDIIVVGASAGGVQALIELARGLPEGLPAAVFVVLHTGTRGPQMLPQIVARAGRLSARLAQDREPILTGRIYIAQADHHLLVKRGVVRVVQGPKENGFRPAVDPLFRTAAAAYGRRVIGVVLSGGLDDGTEGLAKIKDHGGVAVVQSVEEAVLPDMPMSAIQNVAVDHIVAAAEMGPLLARLAREEVRSMAQVQEPEEGPDVVEGPTDGLHDRAPVGDVSVLTCPECGGVLWETPETDRAPRFRCHVGHGYTSTALEAKQNHGLEAALWTALRVLEENIELRLRMASHARTKGLSSIAEEYERRALESAHRAKVIRTTLGSPSGEPTGGTEVG